MYEEARCDERTSDNPPWQWCWSGDHLDIHGCCGVVTLLFFEDDCIPETEDVEWLEEEG